METNYLEMQSKFEEFINSLGRFNLKIETKKTIIGEEFDTLFFIVSGYKIWVYNDQIEVFDSDEKEIYYKEIYDFDDSSHFSLLKNFQIFFEDLIRNIKT